MATMLFGEGGLAALFATLGRRLGAVATRLVPKPAASSGGAMTPTGARGVAARGPGPDAAVRRSAGGRRRRPLGRARQRAWCDRAQWRRQDHVAQSRCRRVRGHSGTLHFGARDITRYSTAKSARAGIRRTFQNLKLFGEMTALENVAIGLHADTRCGFFDAVLRTPRHRREERDIAIDRWRRYASSGSASPPCVRLRSLMGIAVCWRSPAPSWRVRALLLLDEPAAGLNAMKRRM